MDYHPGMRSIPSSEITPNDVLCGRGGNINSHPGNERFRRMVESKKRLYLTSRFKREKRVIACNIVDEVIALNGRFLSKIMISGSKRGRKRAPDPGWYEVDVEKAREKTSQALRENATEIRKELMTEEGPTTSSNDAIEQDLGYYVTLEPQGHALTSDNTCVTQLQNNNADNDPYSWIRDFQEIHMSNSWNSFKTDAASFSSLSMVIPMIGSKSSLSGYSQRNKYVEQAAEDDPLKTPPIREKRPGRDSFSAQPCERKKKNTSAHQMDHEAKVSYVIGVASPDHPSMLPPPPQPNRQIMRDWEAAPINNSAAPLDYLNFGISASMSYGTDVEMEIINARPSPSLSRALVEKPPQKQESRMKRDEEIVERSWFPCSSWTPADWAPSFFSCGPTLFKSDSFEYVSDTICDGFAFDVTNPCGVYLENEPYNKPHTAFDQANIKPSVVQSTPPSLNFENMHMEDRFAGSHSSFPSVITDKSRRSGPENSSENMSASDNFHVSEGNSQSRPRSSYSNNNIADGNRHKAIRMSPIKWTADRNTVDSHQKEHHHQTSNSALDDDAWGIQSRQASGY